MTTSRSGSRFFAWDAALPPAASPPMTTSRCATPGRLGHGGVPRRSGGAACLYGDQVAADIDLAAADRLLTTTRAVRLRLDLDRPVAEDTLLECIAIAQQAPTGGNSQGWSFVVVTDTAKRRRLAELYRDAVGD